MIENPSNFADQFKNFIEHIAGLMKTYYSKSGGAITGNVTVTGDITCTGTVQGATVTSTSDRSKKEDFECVSDEYDISSLVPYRYTLLSDGKKHLGLIAQEVQLYVPEAVIEHYDEKGKKFLSIDYNALTSILLDKINKQEREINTLKKLIIKE